MLLLFILLFIFRPIYIITENEMNILGLTGQHKIARKSGRKFILKFSPQADFNFVQPWHILTTDMKEKLMKLINGVETWNILN